MAGLILFNYIQIPEPGDLNPQKPMAFNFSGLNGDYEYNNVIIESKKNYLTHPLKITSNQTKERLTQGLNLFYLSQGIDITRFVIAADNICAWCRLIILFSKSGEIYIQGDHIVNRDSEQFIRCIIPIC